MKILKKAIILLLVTMLFGCSSSNNTSDADHLEEIKEKGKIVIGTEGKWAPWTYEDEDGNLVGYDVEVGKAICEKLGVEADFVEAKWDGLLMGLDNGTYDLVINGVDITEEREEKYDFSDPYAYSNVVLIVASDNTDINSLEDLDGKTFSNSAGSSYEALGEYYGATNQAVDTFAETIMMITDGRVDATINSLETYNDYLTEHPDSETKIVCEANALDTAIPFVKGDYNTTFKEAVNEALQELRDDGTLSELSIKYFGEDITTR